MRLLPENFLRPWADLQADSPIYYMTRNLYEDSPNLSRDNKEQWLKEFEEAIDCRPFDEMLIVVDMNELGFLIVRLADNGSCGATRYDQGVFVKFPEEYAIEVVGKCIFPFTQKENYIALGTGRAVGVKGKKKAKKQRFVYITSDKREPGGGSVKRDHTFQAHSVAGHKRVYTKNPKTKGHDRNGNEVTGWTWVSPYKRGEGAVIHEKIRVYLKTNSRNNTNQNKEN